MSENTTNERPRRRSTQGRYRPPTWRSLVVIVSFAVALTVYLFVNAPPPLAAPQSPAGARIPIRTVLRDARATRTTPRARCGPTRSSRAAPPSASRSTSTGATTPSTPARCPLCSCARPRATSSARRSASTCSSARSTRSTRRTSSPARKRQHFAALVEERSAPQYFVDPRPACRPRCSPTSRSATPARPATTSTLNRRRPTGGSTT